MAPKAKKRAIATAPASLGRSAGRRQHNPCATGEVERLIDKAFAVSDADNSGSIHFGEFLRQHRLLVRLAAGRLDHGAAPRGLQPRDIAERDFRWVDTDHNLSLDREEFGKYVQGLCSILGARAFSQLMEKFLAEAGEQRREAMVIVREGFDAGSSDLLVHKCKSSNTLVTGSGPHEGAMKLLQAKADPAYQDPDGCSALLCAAEKGDAEFVRYLVEARADPRASNSHGDCAVFRACAVRNCGTLRALLGLCGSIETENGNEDLAGQRKVSEEFVQGLSAYSTQEVAELVRKKADINYKSDSGWTPLTMATFFNRNDVVELFLRTAQQFQHTRVFVNGRNIRGRTALHVAGRKEGADGLITTLVRGRGEPDLQDFDGWTALHHAVFNGLDANVKALIAGGASVHIRGSNGLTPWMVAHLPTRSGDLGKDALEALEPPAAVKFGTQILPVINDESIGLFDRLDKTLRLPGVCGHIQSLRLYDQFFLVPGGPNKVRLRKVWDCLACPLMRRIRTGEVDLEEPLPNLSDDERQEEIENRRKQKKAFIKEFLVDTKGPRPTSEWNHDNRAAFEDDMMSVIEEEIGAFQKEFDALYAALLKQDGGRELAGSPAQEVINEQYLTQLQAHNIPVWVEERDAVGAFDALRDVGVADMGPDDRNATMCFIGLLTGIPELEPGNCFWRNAYRYWLAAYARMADPTFQQRMTRVVDAFNEAHEGEGLTAKYKNGPVKTYEQIQRKEHRCVGAVTRETFASRTRASKVLDVVRGSIVVNCPRAAVLLVEEHFRPASLACDKMTLVRLRNRFADGGETLAGYRDLELTVLFDGGLRTAYRKDATIAPLQIVAEVQIVLEPFLAVKKRRHLLYKCWKGGFDWDVDDRDYLIRDTSGALLQD